jgi:hypothetical protein
LCGTIVKWSSVNDTLDIYSLANDNTYWYAKGKDNVSAELVATDASGKKKIFTLTLIVNAQDVINNKKLKKTDLTLPRDMKIIFGTGGNDTQYIQSGFSGPENGHRWTSGNKASLMFDAGEMAKRDFIVIMNITPLVGRKLKEQRVEVFVDGKKQANWTISVPATQILQLKAKPDDSYYYVEFHLPDAITPKELGINKDVRQLSIAFREIQFH